MMTLIVCTLNRRDELTRLFRSLDRQSDRRFDVVLVDQNPLGTLEPLLAGLSFDVTHVYSAKGLSRARNVGLRNATGDIVAFPDDDCWYPPTLIADVKARFAARPEIDGLTGRTVDEDGRASVSGHLPQSGPLSSHNVFLAGNSNAVFVRRALAQACLFDETLGVGAGTPFGAGEETEFLLGCLRMQARLYYAHDLVVHHDQVARDRSRLWAYAAGFGRVCRLHALGASYLAPRLVRAAGKSVLLTARGQLADARDRWTWIAGSMRGFAARPRGHARTTGRR